MIKIDDIDEYASLMAIKSCCFKNQNRCNECDMTKMCDCMPTSPCNLEIKLEVKNSKEDIENKDAVKE